MAPQRVVLGLVLSCCWTACSETDRTGPSSLDTPVHSDPGLIVVDGANQGNSHFFFLPPLLPQPGYGGSPDGTLSPTVSVCDLGTSTPSRASACVSVVAQFTRASGTANEVIRYDGAGGFYAVNWKTDKSSPALQGSHFYRIEVRVAGTRLGFADVRPVLNMGELKNAVSGAEIPLVDGRTLPLKFRIEAGAIAVIPDEGGTAELGGGAVHLEFAAGAIPSGSTEVGVTAEAVRPVDYPPNTAITAGTLYEFGPSPVTFAAPVTLTLSYPAVLPAGVQPRHLRLCKLDGLRCVAIWSSTVDPAARTVSAPIDGFSAYAITATAPIRFQQMAPGVFMPVAHNYAALPRYWGDGPGNVYVAVGGVLLHYDGSSWSSVLLPSTGQMPAWDVWGRTAADVYAVSATATGGILRHYDGMSWSSVSLPEGEHGSSITGTATDVFVGTFTGRILRYDGTSWTALTPASPNRITRLAVRSPGEIWASQPGAGITRVQYDGTEWQVSPGAELPPYYCHSDLQAVGSDLYVICDTPGGSSAYRYDGTSWTQLSPPGNQQVGSVFAASPTEVYAVTLATVPMPYSPLGTAIFSGILRYDGAIWTEVPLFVLPNEYASPGGGTEFVGVEWVGVGGIGPGHVFLFNYHPDFHHAVEVYQTVPAP